MGQALLLIVALSSVLPVAAPDAQQALASARELYASASYEEALTALNAVEGAPPETAVEVERYRALCLFALGRPDAARSSLEKMIEQDPLYVPSASDVPPRVLEMVREARQAMLPDLARRRYTEAREVLARDGAAAAAPALERLVRITSLSDLSGVEGMADLRLLAEGFLALAKATTENAPAAGAAPANTAAGPETIAPVAAPSGPPIYSAVDSNVVPPETLDQTMPGWTLSDTSRPFGPFTGYLRIVIDEGGNVQEAVLVRSIYPGYDAELLRAARNWHYVPARKDGKPVKFARVINIVLKDR